MWSRPSDACELYSLHSVKEGYIGNYLRAGAAAPTLGVNGGPTRGDVREAGSPEEVWGGV